MAVPTLTPLGPAAAGAVTGPGGAAMPVAIPPSAAIPVPGTSEPVAVSPPASMPRVMSPLAQAPLAGPGAGAVVTGPTLSPVGPAVAAAPVPQASSGAGAVVAVPTLSPVGPDTAAAPVPQASSGAGVVVAVPTLSPLGPAAAAAAVPQASPVGVAGVSAAARSAPAAQQAVLRAQAATTTTTTAPTTMAAATTTTTTTTTTTMALPRGGSAAPVRPPSGGVDARPASTAQPQAQQLGKGQGTGAPQQGAVTPQQGAGQAGSTATSPARRSETNIKHDHVLGNLFEGQVSDMASFTVAPGTNFRRITPEPKAVSKVSLRRSGDVGEGKVEIGSERSDRPILGVRARSNARLTDESFAEEAAAAARKAVGKAKGIVELEGGGAAKLEEVPSAVKSVNPFGI